MIKSTYLLQIFRQNLRQLQFIVDIVFVIVSLPEEWVVDMTWGEEGWRREAEEACESCEEEDIQEVDN